MISRFLATLAFLVLAAALGVTVAGALGLLFTGDPAYIGVWAYSVPVVLVSFLIFELVRRNRRGSARSPADTPVDTDEPPVARKRRARPTPLIALAVAVAVVAAGITLIPAYTMIGRTLTNVATGNWDGNSMLTGDYQQDAVDAIAQVAGHYDFTRVTFDDDVVLAEGPAAPGADTAYFYLHRYGRAWRGEPLDVQPDLAAELFDAEAIDFSLIARLVERTIDEAMTPPGTSTYTKADVLVLDGELVARVSMTHHGGTSVMAYDLEGNELSRSGAAFE